MFDGYSEIEARVNGRRVERAQAKILLGLRVSISASFCGGREPQEALQMPNWQSLTLIILIVNRFRHCRAILKITISKPSSLRFMTLAGHSKATMEVQVEGARPSAVFLCHQSLKGLYIYQISSAFPAFDTDASRALRSKLLRDVPENPHS